VADGLNAEEDATAPRSRAVTNLRATMLENFFGWIYGFNINEIGA
jgi:hypothetical protein